MILKGVKSSFETRGRQYIEQTASDARVLIVLDTSVQNGIGDLVADFVWEKITEKKVKLCINQEIIL